MYIRYLLLAYVAIMASACASNTTIRHSSDYQSAIARSNHQVLIMPPVAEVNMVDISSKKSRMYDYEYHLEDIIIREVIPALQEQGLRAKLVRRRDLHDQDLRADAARLRSRYDEVREELYKEVSWDKEKAFDVNENTGPFATAIGEKNQGDLIVMIDYARDVKTSGARTFEVLKHGLLVAEADRSVIIIAIIDAKNGKLLWSNLGMDVISVLGSGMDNSKTEDQAASDRIKTIMSTMFKKFNEEEVK